MRAEIKRKLDAELRRQRLKRYAFYAALALSPLLAIYIFQHPAERIVHKDALVTWSARRFNADTGQPYVQMRAKLGDGRTVSVRSRTQTLPPEVNSQVVVTEERYRLEYKTFQWEGAR